MAVTLGGYFLVGKYESKSYQVNTQIKKLELSIAQVNKDIEIAKKKVIFTTESLKLISSLRPNFDFQIDNKIDYKNLVLTVTFNTQNKSEHRVIIQPKSLWITDTIARNINEIKESSVLGKIENISLISDVESRGTQGHSFEVKLSSKPPTTVYYLMVYKVRTDPVIMEFAKKYIEGLSATSLQEITVSTQIRYGQISF